MNTRFEQLADLPPGLAGAELVRPSLDWSGAPLLACSSRRGSVYSLSVRRYDGDRWREVLEVETPHVLPHVQLIPGDDVLVAGTRSFRDAEGIAELNASIYDPAGFERRRILLGDGIEDVQANALGEIWVSYFDEGTMGDFGRYGWGRLSPERWIEPIGGAGLVRFDLEGARQYEFAPPAGYAAATDCYALNVAGAEVWLCYHPGFPLVRIDAGRASGWQTGGIGADALAVSDARVLLHAGYGLHRGTCWVGQLGDDGTAEIASVEVTLPEGRRLSAARWVLGRGSALHAVDRTGWHRLELAGG
jgi:hypothetical protein